MGVHSAVLLIVLIFAWALWANEDDLSDNSSEWMNVLVCVKNTGNSNKRMGNLARVFDSVLRNARRRPIRWLVVTQQEEVTAINYLMRKIVEAQAQVPVRIVYLDIKKIAQKFSFQINTTRENLLCARPPESSRFWDEVFHIGNLYHAVFPFKRLVVLDLDLKFLVDIDDLYQQFKTMEATNKTLALAYDLAPYYWFRFHQYLKKNPNSSHPNYKGFNTGVVLMNLHSMRQNSIYNSYFSEPKLKSLIAKYEWVGCVAYQDFFTLLGVEHPEMFHVLDCTWNRQLDEALQLDVEFNRFFNIFHQCDGQIKVYHGNGGSDLPGDNFFPENGQLIN